MRSFDLVMVVDTAALRKGQRVSGTDDPGMPFLEVQDGVGIFHLVTPGDVAPAAATQCPGHPGELCLIWAEIQQLEEVSS